ncbi:MAG: hypothetical protein K2O16_18295 [Lachnospiraceae bacterium]|nr:hypothetical protein [Lachnospiraceae bacterium]
MMEKRKIIILLLAVLIFTGCRAEENRKSQTAADREEIREDIAQGAEEEAGAEEEPEESVQPQVQMSPVKVSGKAVGIEAHIKEVKGQEILISSDCDGFPGAFEVEVPESVFDISLLTGGTAVRIVMEEKDGTDEDLCYQARGIEIVPEQGETAAAEEEKYLTSPPAFVLIDPLSSTYASFEIYPGNYSWNYKDGDEMAGVIACGAHPLDDMEREKLKVPQYNGMEAVRYRLSTESLPDTLIINAWDAEDIGNTLAETLSELTFYYPVATVDLEKGKVYEITAVWEQDRLEQRGFYGDASYTLITE